MHGFDVTAVVQLVMASFIGRGFPLKTVLQVLEVVTAGLLILGVLLQTPRSSSGLGGTIGGGGDVGGGYRTKRGVEKSLFQVTCGLSILFVLLSVANVKVA
ncbi:MAG: preprotein translocase subunit SecG [Candidatus Dormibacteraeota bacterium]|nr:preprotein translocase subunit SecG [Candidatus Dormibacteraeota bacterium]